LRDVRVTLLDLIQAAERGIAYLGDMSEVQFSADERTQWAVWAQVVVMGEAVRRLPEQWIEERPDVPWRSIADMRNRLVHGYDVVRWGKVWDVFHHEIPKLLPQLRAYLGKDAK